MKWFVLLWSPDSYVVRTGTYVKVKDVQDILLRFLKVKTKIKYDVPVGFHRHPYHDIKLNRVIDIVEFYMTPTNQIILQPYLSTPIAIIFPS